MSNQIVISSGAKVRSLEGVLTGTAGIVNSVPLGGANGVATLDSSGKVPVSQLPASVVTYLGTWNAATNTPTLTNGVGDAGDLYICNVAGTVNFGAGPITFAVGDWVIYGSGTWQKSSGQNGTVTSVAASINGNAIGITGSPITTAGTLAFAFAGTSGQYINGAGNLVTFPSLTGYVPYTGATTDVDLGAHVLNAQALHVKGTAGAGHLGLKHQSAAATGSANESLIYANVDGDLAWQNDNLYLTTLSTHANTANRVYTFPNASGTIALTSDISYPVTSVFGRTGAVTAQSGDYTTTQVTEGTNLYYTDARARGAISLTTTGSSGAATYNSTTGVFNIPNYGSALSGYVPYTGATTDVNLGYRSISASNINIDGYSFGDGGAINFKQFTSLSLAGTGYTSIGANSTNILTFGFNQGSLNLKGFKLDVAGLTTNVWRTYTMPNTDGTLALTSDIPSLANYVTLTGTQTITGIKTFTNEQLFGNGMTLTGGYITYTSGSFNLTLNTNILTANRNVYIKDGSGTLAFTSDIPSLSGYVQGSGTTNYHAKFTAGSTIGNSMLTDDGTTLQSIGATRSNLYLKAASNSYYSQLAFTNGSNGSFGGLSYNNASQYMQFEVNSSEYMRLYGNGNLRLFTSSATDNGSKFQVEGAATFSSSVTSADLIVTDTYANDPLIKLATTTSGNVEVQMRTATTTYNAGIGVVTSGYDFSLFTNNTERLRLSYGGNTEVRSGNTLNIYRTDNTRALQLYTTANECVIDSWEASSEPLMIRSNGSGGRIVFHTNGAERMRITSGGDVLIGQTTASGSVNGIYLRSGQDSGMIATSDSALSLTRLSTNGKILRFFYAGSEVGSISTNTNSLPSDLNFKKDITDMSLGLNLVNKLRPVHYRHKMDNEDEPLSNGIIAQELEEALLECGIEKNTLLMLQHKPTEDKNQSEYWVDYIKIIPILINSIKELSAKVTALENKI